MKFEKLKGTNREQEHQELENKFFNLVGMKLRIPRLKQRFMEFKRSTLKIILCLGKANSEDMKMMLCKNYKIKKILKLKLNLFRKWMKEIGEYLKRIMKL